MARYNEILVGRYNRFIQKLLGMKGEASLFQFSTEMQGTLNFFSGVENRYLEGWDRYSFNFTQAGTAAQNATVQLRNPAGSNVMVVVEKLAVNATNGGFANPQVRLGPLNTDLGTLQTLAASRIDARSRPNPSTIISSSNTLSGGLTARFSGVAPLNQQVEFVFFEDQELTILPGDSLQIVEQVVNQALTPTLLWRERFLEESERT